MGFPVHQRSPVIEEYRLRTCIGGQVRLRLPRETEEEDPRKAQQGAPPNLVHSVDACHLMMTVNRAKEAGIENFACIHDDFGTHACHTTAFARCIREAFLELHASGDILQRFKAEQEARDDVGDLPPVPPSGDLNINDVLDAAYFFG